MKLRVYGVREFIDSINTFVAEFMTERWYQNILDDIAEEYKQELLKVYKKL